MAFNETKKIDKFHVYIRYLTVCNYNPEVTRIVHAWNMPGKSFPALSYLRRQLVCIVSLQESCSRGRLKNGREV